MIMRRQWVTVTALALAMLAAGAARANNLQITNLTVMGRDSTTAYVKFDISWENSWRAASGGDPLYFHDAAWVFFKVLPDGQTEWQHVTLEGTGTNATGYGVGTGTGIELVVPTDRVGMFVRRSGDGAGTTAVQNVQAVWNFATNGLTKYSKVKVQAFGVEMVYVAQGAFKVGSGGTGSGELYEGGGGTSPFAITNAGPILCSNVVGCLWGSSQSGDNSMGGNGVLATNFPNGYAAFYCMKYEVTEGQLVDFFNTLTDSQKTTRDITSGVNGGKNSDGVVTRNTVAWTSGDATTTRRDRACNYLSWGDLMAFTDWAGLRPMTELEFEKACRGPMAPVADEYAWGTATIMGTTRAISGAENGTERITSDTASGGCNYGNTAHTGGDAGTGLLRVGIFATNGASRASAGASYWGIMELSGSLWERPVTIGNANGRAFTGLHGNGVLTTGGDANVTAWPDTTANGAGVRGGSWYDAATYARMSDRSNAARVVAGRYSNYGGRAVRSAPSGVGP